MKQTDPLDDLIASWRETSPPDAGLRRRVWARIDAAAAAKSPSRGVEWRALWMQLFGHRRTLAWVAVCIALGVASAEMRASRVPLQDLGKMGMTYLRIINPLLRDGASGPP